MKNKKLLFLAIPMVIAILVIVISFGNKQQKPDDIQITTQKQEYTTLGLNEKEYTMVGDDGITYQIKKDGMYFEKDGNLTKLREYVNIPVFNTYTYSYPNGNTVKLTLNEDATFEAITTYPNGYYQKDIGHYKMTNGVEETIINTNIKNPKELADSFLMPLPNLNPNNVYRIQLYSDGGCFYQEGNETPNESPEVEEKLEDDSDVLFNDLLLILDTGSSSPQKDENGEYYPVVCRGYSVSDGFFYTEFSQNGLIKTNNNKYYINGGKHE